MLTCQQLTELVTDYLEGRMSFVERMSVQMHLGMCGRCRAYLRQMKMTVRTLGKLPAEAIPAAYRDELLARFRSMQPRSATTMVALRWPARFLAAVERALGARRGWMFVALVLAASLLFVFFSGATAGPLIDGRVYVLTDLLTVLGAGAVPLALVVSLAWWTRGRLSPSVFAATASLGALVGYVSLQLTCEMALVAPHVLVFHIGGIVLAGAMGALASRLPALR